MKFFEKNTAIAAICLAGTASLATTGYMAFRFYDCYVMGNETPEEFDESIKTPAAVCVSILVVAAMTLKVIYDLELNEEAQRPRIAP